MVGLRKLKIICLVPWMAALCLTAAAAASTEKIVIQQGTKSFMPQETKVKAGDKVVWINRDGEEHFLTSTGPASRQQVLGTENLEIHQLLQPSESYSYTFQQPDTYHYFCAIHLQMWGTVIVEK